MTQALDAATQAIENETLPCMCNSLVIGDRAPQVACAALRAALPAEPDEEELGLMWNAYRWACRTGCNPMAAVRRALRAHLLGEDA